MKKLKDIEEKVSIPITYYTIDKKKMALYDLLQLTILDGKVEIKVLHTDIPPIVYAKFLQILQSQGFSNGR